MSLDSNIRLVRIDDPFLIPRHLIEQLPQDVFDVGSFLQNYTASPANLLFLVTDRKDDSEPRKGFFWAQANTLSNTLQIWVLSLDKNFSREHPAFLQLVLVPHFKGAARKAGMKLAWSRFRPVRQTETKHGRVTEWRNYLLEVANG